MLQIQYPIHLIEQYITLISVLVINNCSFDLHLISAVNAWAARSEHTTARLIATNFLGHGCMDDLTTLIRKLRGSLMCSRYSFGIFAKAYCTTRHWQTSSRLMPKLVLLKEFIKPSTVLLYSSNCICLKITLLMSHNSYILLICLFLYKTCLVARMNLSNIW